MSSARSIASLTLLLSCGACASRVVSTGSLADASSPDVARAEVATDVVAPDVVAPDVGAPDVGAPDVLGAPDIRVAPDVAMARDTPAVLPVEVALCAADAACPEGMRCDARHRCVVACFPGVSRCVGARTRETCAVDGATRVRTECLDRASATGVCRAEGCAVACDPGAFDCDDDPLTGCESHAPCPSVMLSGFGGSTGYGPDTQCLHPSNDGSYAGPHAREGDAPVAVDLSAAFPDGFRAFGVPIRSLFVNVNGNVTARRALAAATPSAFPIEGQWMVAPWWADVDTRGGGQPARNNICFVVQPHRFIVTWDRVGRFDRHDDRLDSVQLVLRSGVEGCALHDFDIELRYARCEWDAGDASGGVSAQAGFEAGDLRSFVSLPQSRTPAIVDLCRTSNVPGGPPGLYRFLIRSSPCSGGI